MGLDLDKIVDFTTEHSSEYAHTLIATLVSPSARFAPVSLRSDSILNVPTELTGSRLNPRLLLYVAISIAAGVTINSLFPRPIQGPVAQVEGVLTALLWLFAVSMIHLWCRILGGRGTYVETASVLLQVFATLYVVVSVVGVLLHALDAAGSRLGIALFQLGASSAEVVGTVLMLIYATLILVYMPLSLRHVHRFGWLRGILVAAPSAFIGLTLGVILFVGSGAVIPMG